MNKLHFFEKRDIMDRIDDYIEFATATRRFSDVGFYEDVKNELRVLLDRIEHLETGARELIEEWNQQVDSEHTTEIQVHKSRAKNECATQLEILLK